jgi:hypothetical protein
MSTVQNAKHLLLQGLDQARGEWLLLAACHNQRHRHSALGYRTRAEYARRAGTPTPRSPPRSTESGTKQPDSKSGWTQNRGLATTI